MTTKTTNNVIIEEDLDVSNYSFQDLLNLFDVPENMNELHLREAKRMVYKLHPDKSRLDSKYFIFYTKALKMLVELYKHRKKIDIQLNSVVPTEDQKYNPKLEDFDLDLSEIDTLEYDMKQQTQEKQKIDFDNKKFNELWEKNIGNLNGEHGYGEWLKTAETFINPQFSNENKVEMETALDAVKQSIKDVIEYKGVSEINSGTMGSFLIGEKDEEFSYSSPEIFSRHSGGGGGLVFEDVRLAHTETLIPITKNDFHKIPKFETVDEYKRYSDSHIQNIQFKEFDDNNRKLLEERRAMERTYILTKQMEEAKKLNSIMSSQFRLLN